MENTKKSVGSERRVNNDKQIRKIKENSPAAFSNQDALAFAKEVAVVRLEIEQLGLVFSNLLSSAAESRVVVQSVVDIASTMPFDLKEVAEEAKNLLVCGSAPEDVGNDLEMLGRIALELSVPLSKMVSVYCSIQKHRKLSVEDLAQLEELGVASGFKAEVDFDEVRKALQVMISTGGKFGGEKDALSCAMCDSVNSLNQEINNLLVEIKKETASCNNL